MPKTRSTMSEKLSARQEDYLETIADLTDSHGHAHVRDIARARGVTMATVSEAVRNLADRGYVLHDSWGTVTLTSVGLKRARQIKHRHETLREFFRDLLGLPEDIAEHEACTIEHSIAAETLRRIERLIECVKRCRETRGEGCRCLARLRQDDVGRDVSSIDLTDDTGL